MPQFVLNDETVINSYGFRISTSGIDLKRFRANPVMLDQHYNSTSAVLGRWTNIQVEEGRLTADDEFDEADEKAKLIKGKVDRGFIKGASVGVSFSRDNMKLMPDGTYVLVKCELYEASIVAIPSNSQSLRLYAPDTGQLLSEADIQLTLSALPAATDFKKEKMEKLVLSATLLVALGLQNTDDAAAISNAIARLHADYEKEKGLREAAEKKLADQAKLQADALISGAIAEGKLTADLKDHFVTLAMQNYEAAAKVIGAMPVKQSLAATLSQGGGKPTSEVKTMDDFEKLPLDKQLALKNENPDAYRALFA